jgi:hypothetical protein
MRLVIIGLIVGATLVLSAPAGASSGVRFGVQDDSWLAHGPGTLDDRLDRLVRLGVDLVRFNLHWDRIERVRGKPDWEESDLVLEGLRARRIPAVVGIVGSPRWANAGRTPNFAPGASSFARFARTAAARYRWVNQWLIWNEPNQRRWLRPTDAGTYVRQLLNPGYRAIHAVNPRAKVAGGVTAPRAATGGVSPVAFIRGMRAAGARLDAYAHHPYPSSTRETPFSGGCAHCLTITMATLERLLAEVGRAFGTRKRIWLTEYGYQTGAFGVSQRRQAELIGQSGRRAHETPRVDMLIHYLVKDEPNTERFQSGLFNVSDRAKLAALAFPLPLAQAGRSGGALVLWGQVRPRSGVQTYRVQVRTGGAWRFSGGVRRTGARGFFSTKVAAPPGASVRIYSPRDNSYSAPVGVQ